jgi:amphi-Trp domain-containing protein
MTDEFESEQRASRDEAATILRDAADGVAGGSLRFDSGERAVTIELPEELGVEIEYETEDGARSVEIELEWPDDSPQDDQSATEDSAEADPTAAVEGGTEANPPTETEDSPVGPAAPPLSLAQFELFRDRAAEWRWRLIHRNGNVIATSGEGYTRKRNAVKGLRSVMRNSPDATVTEKSEGDT